MRGNGPVGMPGRQPAQPPAHRFLRHGRGPPGQPATEHLMGGDRQHRPGGDGPGEQRHGRQQVPVRLGQPGGIELQHLAHPGIGARRRGQAARRAARSASGGRSASSPASTPVARACPSTAATSARRSPSSSQPPPAAASSADPSAGVNGGTSSIRALPPSKPSRSANGNRLVSTTSPAWSSWQAPASTSRSVPSSSRRTHPRPGPPAPPPAHPAPAAAAPCATSPEPLPPLAVPATAIPNSAGPVQQALGPVLGGRVGVEAPAEHPTHRPGCPRLEHPVGDQRGLARATPGVTPTRATWGSAAQRSRRASSSARPVKCATGSGPGTHRAGMEGRHRRGGGARGGTGGQVGGAREPVVGQAGQQAPQRGMIAIGRGVQHQPGAVGDLRAAGQDPRGTGLVAGSQAITAT